MPNFVHRNGDRYRMWSTVVDQYLTPPMTRAEMGDYLAQTEGGAPSDAAAHLRRADAQGTSQMDDTRDASTWDDERCDHCATFHHAFAPRAADARCGDCGEPPEHRAHRPPCRRRAPRR